MRGMVALVAALGLVASGAVPAGALTAHLITASSLVDATPGPDLRIGTADDVAETGAFGPSGSGPNAHGAASFALLDSGGTTPTGTSFTYALFVDGTIEFTPDYTASTAGSLVLVVTGGSLRSTAEFGYPGRGEATTTIASGTAQLDPLTGAGTVQLGGTFTPSTSPAFQLTGETLTAAPGMGVIVLPASFGHSGNHYVDEVLTPLVPANATAIVLVEFTGTVQSAGCCTGFVTHGVLAAYTTDALGCADVFPALCPAGAACQTIAACRAALDPALPSAAQAASRKAKHVARKLAQLAARASALIDKGGAKSGAKQQKLYGRAQQVLRALLAAARAADGKGTLGVPLAPLEAAVNALIAKL
ncbi:MAG TPA: hypothetical protein VKW76_09220 [Candidatus Binatia bacterium]|nr:hypothetical protein [Candidatus Binatia bacterium]